MDEVREVAGEATPRGVLRRLDERATGGHGDLEGLGYRLLGLDVVVWTVNKPVDIENMLALKVDGIISDRPDLVRAAMAKREMRLPRATPVAAGG